MPSLPKMSLLSSLPDRQTFTTSFKNNYSYIHISSTKPNQTTLLLLHGFPSHAPDWINQINFFSHIGYGIIAPDLLGYGQTSKPQDAHAYRLKLMSDDLAELLDYLKVKRLVGIGHDFGSTLLSRFAVYYPDRVSACVFLAVGPPRLGTPFDVDAINRTTKGQMGYEMLGYIPFISRHPESQVIMEKHADSVMSLLFCANERDEWARHFRPANTFEKFVAGGKLVEIGGWYAQELQRAHLAAFGKDGGYAGAIGWYAMWDEELFKGDEVGLEQSRITVPGLFIGSGGENGMQAGFLKDWVNRLDVQEINGGHWVHLEKAKEVNELIAKFLQTNVS
jgi:pimeloyl-ACP methyl ester carboxylesterase